MQFFSPFLILCSFILTSCSIFPSSSVEESRSSPSTGEIISHASTDEPTTRNLSGTIWNHEEYKNTPFIFVSTGSIISHLSDTEKHVLESFFLDASILQKSQECAPYFYDSIQAFTKYGYPTRDTNMNWWNPYSIRIDDFIYEANGTSLIDREKFYSLKTQLYTDTPNDEFFTNEPLRQCLESKEILTPLLKKIDQLIDELSQETR